jgi:hypothetical protein
MDAGDVDGPTVNAVLGVVVGYGDGELMVAGLFAGVEGVGRGGVCEGSAAGGPGVLDGVAFGIPGLGANGDGVSERGLERSHDGLGELGADVELAVHTDRSEAFAG